MADAATFTAVEYVLGGVITILSATLVKMALYITQQAEARRTSETELLKIILPLNGKLIELLEEKLNEPK